MVDGRVVAAVFRIAQSHAAVGALRADPECAQDFTGHSGRPRLLVDQLANAGGDCDLGVDADDFLE